LAAAPLSPEKENTPLYNTMLKIYIMGQQTTATTLTTPLHPPVLHLTEALRSDVVLGSPSARCNGVGICRVMGVGEYPDCPCPRISTLLLPNPNGAIRLAFDKSTLSAELLQQHFGWGVFQVLEPYRISPRMCKQLGWKSGWIHPGVYKVWESESALIIDFSQADRGSQDLHADIH
jgi:hypothetical protein